MTPTVGELCDMAREFGIDDLSKVRSRIKKQLREHSGSCGEWSRGTWWSWVKNRVLEIGIPSSFSNPDMSHATAVLHVFPLSWISTEDEIARLHNESAVTDGEPSRSRISKYTKTAKPIDAVACRVAPTDGMNQTQ